MNGDTVEVHYVLTLTDGSSVDSSRERSVPFSFTVGSGDVIRGFDAAVMGLSVGDVRTVEIQPADAYGEWDEDRVLELPIAAGQEDVAVGDVVYLNTGQPVTVVEVSDETVKVDANHELAGKTLVFEIEVLGITRPG
ncbi:MAG: peptidylprolyl isomerase [Acidimicrobiia bacterium]